MVPFQLAAGRKRSLASAARISAAPSVTFSTAVQAVPLQYCQTPCAAVAALVTTATPAKPLPAEPNTASVGSENSPPNSDATLAPAGSAPSSATAPRTA